MTTAAVPNKNPTTVRTIRRGSFSINILSNILNFALTITVGVFLTPYLISKLGVTAYGVISIMIYTMPYLGLLTLALNSTVGRFLTIALAQEDHDRANHIFNTSLVGSMFIALLLLPVILWLSFHGEYFFKIPADLIVQSHWLFLAAFSVLMITAIGAPFEVASFCRNRFDLRSLIISSGTLTRVVAIILLFSFFTPRLMFVGYASLAASLISFLGVILVWRYLMPTLHISLKLFDWAILRKLLYTGGWVVTNQAGALLYLSIDVLVVSWVLGVTSAGNYSAVMSLSSLLRGLSAVLAGVFAPTIFSLYAKKDIGELVNYSRRAVKFIGLAMALPIGLICGLSRPILYAWLGPSFVELAPLMSLMTVHLCVNLGVIPLFHIQVATNSVRWPGIITFVMGATNLGLAFLLSGPMNWGMYGVAAAGAIMLTAKNLIFTPMYGARILGKSYGTFYHETIPIILCTLAIAALGWVISPHILIHTVSVGGAAEKALRIATVFRIILVSAGVSIIFAAGVYCFALSRPERKQLLEKLHIKRPGMVAG